MKFADKEAIVVAAGFDPNQTDEWFKKYQNHAHMSVYRGVDSQLSFEQYLTKVREGGLSDPANIGRRKGQFVLGRDGDIGQYGVENCRFIPVEQNLKEAYSNGIHADSVKRRAEGMIGQTKENSERVRKAAETRTGRTKGSHPEQFQNSIEARSKDFVLVSPDGVVHRGTNVREFCEANSLHVYSIYNVFAGRKNHYKGWTGHYVDSRS